MKFKFTLIFLTIFSSSGNYLFSQTEWTLKVTGISASLNSVTFIGKDTGYAVGDSGCIIKSVNGGENWIRQISGVPYKLNSVYFNSASDGFIAGQNGIILKTTTGGITWTIVNELNSGERFNSVFFPSDQIGYVVGDNGKLYKTIDSGSNWNIVNANMSGNSLRSVFFVNDLKGWISIYGDTYKTTNGGINWTHNTHSESGGNSLFFLDSLNGWCSGMPGALNTSLLYHTTNGGIDWNAEDSFSANIFASIYFVDYNKGWNVGGDEIKYTSNGGTFWGTQFTYPENLHSVFFADSMTGWVAGSHGLILKTTNGGGGGFSPVELTFFTSKSNRNNVILIWSTARELNNTGYDVEKKSVSTNSTNDWAKVGFVNGNGTTNDTKNYTFTDRSNSGKFNYRLKQIDFNGNFEYFNLSNEIEVGVPGEFALSQNYPNPFNPSTKINYDLPKVGLVTIVLYDLTGRQVASIVNEVKTAGYYTVQFNASNLSSGMYFYRITSGNFISTKKMAPIK